MRTRVFFGWLLAALSWIGSAQSVRGQWPLPDQEPYVEAEELGPMHQAEPDSAPPVLLADEFFAEAPAVVESSGSWLRGGLRYFEADAVFLNRDMYRNIVLATDASTGNQLIVEQREPDVTTSARMTLGTMLFRGPCNADHALEFTYFGLGDWKTTGQLHSLLDNFIVSNISSQIGGFNLADSQSFVYDANFNSFELNYRVSQRLGRDQLVLRPDGEWTQRLKAGHLWSALAGLRVVQLDEDFSYISRSTPPDLRRGDLQIQTDNALVGFQLGGELRQQFVRWNVGVRGCAGPYINFASRDMSLVTVDPERLQLNTSSHTNDETFAFVGQLAIFSKYHFRPNLSLRTAYELLWLNSVVLAPEQVQFTPGAPPDIATGAQFYQGFSVGLELMW